MKITATEPDLLGLARVLIVKFKPGDVVTFSGPLGAGKTTLIQQILKTMGYAGPVNSPTFVLEHRYPVSFRQIKTVLHLDFYRLTEKDLVHFDWDDYLASDHQLTLIEWPKVAKKYLPAKTKSVTIEILDAKTRRITVSSARH